MSDKVVVRDLEELRKLVYDTISSFVSCVKWLS